MTAVKGDLVSSPPVIILLATYNGAAYLRAQLDSIAAQTHGNWQLWVSDDGSSDATSAILDQFAAEHPNQVQRHSGPQQGVCQNFMSLLHQFHLHAPAGVAMAFCDQDDVWTPTRLDAGLSALQSGPPDQPALFCSRLMVTDGDLTPQHLSVARPKPPSFQNALVQNIASGNTQLLNPAAAQALAQTAAVGVRPVIHDWWAYLVVTGLGGRVIHSDTPLVLYRQHDTNQIGSNTSLRAKLRRIGMLANGHFKLWNDQNLAALKMIYDQLTPAHQKQIAGFETMRQMPLPARARAFAKLNLYHQTPASQAALWLAVLCKRL